MLRFFLFICGALVVACASFGPADPEKADLHLRVGTSLLQNGRYPEALSELLTAAELDPDNAIIQNNLGLTYFAREKFDLAEKHLRKAISLNKGYTDAKNNLGRLLIEVRRFPEADAILTEALNDLTYTSPEKIYLNLGLSAFEQKNFARARQHLLKALDFQRNNCAAQTLYGRVLLEQKEFQRAASTLDRAVGFCNGGPTDEPQYYGALAYYAAGDHRKAETRLDELLKLYPNGTFYERARSMLETMRK